MTKIINVFLICGLSLLLLSCNENPPTSMTDNATQTKSSEGAITFITLPTAPNSLHKWGTITDTKLISARTGGTLQVYFEYPGPNGKVIVSASLNIPAGALPYNQYLTMSLDQQTLSGSVDVTFGPHGTMFSIPALLNIDAKGLDLSSVPSNANVQLYYFNPTTNKYDLMAAKKEMYNLNDGMIQCKDGQLPHFSRYAFGYVR
jgi:hypothetical protein